MKFLKNVLSLLIVVSFLTLVEVITDNPSRSQKSATIGATVSDNKTFSDYNSPLLVSQLVAPAYSCLISLQQPNTTPPTANYYASLTCSAGQPGGFALSVYNSNVNFPTDRRYIGNNNYTCTLTASSCATPAYARTITKTQNLWIYAGVNIVGIDGKVYTRTDTSPTLRTYNDKGASYPFIKPTRTDMAVVPFPFDPPYVERVPRDTSFPDELRKIYVAKNWTIPSDSPQAHHIKPLAW